MIQYAHYIDEHTVQYPRADEFRGIPNWLTNDAALRARDYVPLIGHPEERLGVEPISTGYRYHERTKTRIEPVQDEHGEWHDTEITIDDSYIEVTSWDYVPITPPEPAPLPTQFSKGSLLEALQACNLYTEAKIIYMNDLDLQIAWAGFADIDLDYKATQDIMEKYPDFFNEENVQLLREWIRDHQ